RLRDDRAARRQGQAARVLLREHRVRGVASRRREGDRGRLSRRQGPARRHRRLAQRRQEDAVDLTGVVLAYASCALICGTTWFGIRVCIGADGSPTLDAVFLRFAIAAGVLLPLAARARPWPRGTQWVYIVLAGWLDATAYLLVYLGEERVSGGVAAVL